MSVEIPTIPKALKSRYLIDTGTDKVTFIHLKAKPHLNRCPTALVPPKDEIYDEKKGEVYPIYYKPKVTVKDGVKVLTTSEMWFTRERMGTITCDLKTRTGREMYEFLCMSNYNISNPFRDKSVRPIFKMMNSKKEAQASLQSEKQVVMAKSAVFSMKGEDVRQFSDWMGIDSRQPIQVLRQELLKVAASKPSDISETKELLGEYGEYLTNVIRGRRHNIIEPDRRSSRWRFVDSKIYIVGYDMDHTETQNVLQLAKFFKDGETAGKHYTKLLDKLKEYKDQYSA